MRKSIPQHSKLFAVLLGGALLSACGAGSSDSPSASTQLMPTLVSGPIDPPAAAGAPIDPPAAAVAPIDPPAAAVGPIDPPAAAAAPIDPPAQIASIANRGGSAEVPLRRPDMASAPPPPTTLSLANAAKLTDVRFESTASNTQQQVPVTFGQVFAPGHVSAAHTVVAKMADGSTLPLQVDVKARHPDGSVRHAILSAKIAQLLAGQTETMIVSTASAGAPAAATTPAGLLGNGFSASVNIDLDGQRYSASADDLLRSGNYQTWLSGPVANEWLVTAPLTTAQGSAHPHLTARFAIRAYSGSKQSRVDVTIENNWAYAAAPQNFKYDAQVLVGGLPVYSKTGMTHYHHARWRKVFWWGTQPAVHVKHNVAYLIGTRALPNFDQSIAFPETKLAAYKAGWTGTKIEPMNVGQALPAMPSTGGRDDIGLLPGWAATYLLSQDKRAKEVTMGTADLAGTWSAHYRDQKTGQPVSLVDYPYMTILGQRTDTKNPATKQLEAFPLCATTTACASPFVHDTSHQPAFAYLPYMVSGDHYYLEELQFWAMYSALSSNPGYRENVKGLVKPDQVRGQAWSLRTLGEAAYITPDNDRLKSHFNDIVNHNLDWYTSNYLNGTMKNDLGVLSHGYAIAYSNGLGLAPWMDDFFTSAMGHLSELGFAKAKPILLWKAKFPISRMIGANACWINGAMYAMKVRDTATSPLYTTIGQAWKASTDPTLAATACASSAMASILRLKVGEMTGYSSVHTGFPSNMQPALAYAADVGGLSGTSAWGVFMARSVKPNYGLGPQFAIVPR